MAMTAAETGHLVLGTLHTTGAVKTIDRIIDALPVEEREQTKSFLAQSLLAVVTQVLIKTADARGRKAICEVMVMTKADRQAHPDATRRTRFPRSCRRAASTACRCSTRRCSPPSRRRKSIRTTRTATRRTSALFQKYVTDTSVLPKLDAAAAAATPALRQRQAEERAHGQPSTPTCNEVLDKRGSDLHFIAGDPPRIRLYGDLTAAAAGAARTGLREGRAVRDHAEDRAGSLRGRRTARTSPTRSPSAGAFA